jgi:hypothetical protein
VVPTLDTLYTVALALSAATNEPVTLADLIAGTGPVALNAELTVSRKQLDAFCSGGPPTGKTRLSPRLAAQLRVRAESDRHRGLLEDFREADVRVCKRLGLDVEIGADLMGELWGRVFSAERDRRAPADAKPQHLGIIARELQNELRDKMTQERQ